MLNAWPIAADSTGMMGQFWVADGSYRVRATNASGSITYFDQPSVLALGASSGAAPSGGVDANAIFATGDVMWLDRSGTKTGWVRDNGRTIGSATSGSSERANADCQALFEYLWNTYSNTICPVVTGRGASANADWTANKQITTPDKRGYIAIGADDMGNSAAGRLSAAPIISGSVTTVGSAIGESTHTTTTAEMPAHNHTATSTVTDPGHFHAVNNVATINAGAQSIRGASNQAVTVNTESATTGVTVATTTTNTGSGGAHNNVQLGIIGTWYRKL